MTTNATAIRDAVFARVSPLVPAGGTAWGLARTTTYPSLATTQLPAIQVILLEERLTPDGDANAGVPRFFSETTIGVSVIRGIDDPAVLDGNADQDLDNILNALLTDPTFTSSSKDAPFWFEGVGRIDNERHVFKDAEAYMINLQLKMVFEFRLEFLPNPTVPLESIAVTIKAFEGSPINP